MAWVGQVIKQEFKMIPLDQTAGVDDLNIPSAVIRCCFSWPVYAALVDDDPKLNDFKGFIKSYNSGVVSVDMYLQKVVNGDYLDQVQLVDDTFGTFYAYGFQERNGNSSVGYKMQWKD